MKKEEVCGIYMIENKINGKKYIGQSRHILNRWSQHLNSLKKNRHYNQHLQNSWNKHGEDSFLFSIVCVVKKDLINFEEILLEKEFFYIKRFNSTSKYCGYNLRGSQICKVKDSEEMLKIRRMNKFAIPIVQLTLIGDYVRTWRYGAREAARDSVFIQPSIRSCLSKDTSAHKGFIWVTEKEYIENNKSIDLKKHYEKFDGCTYNPIVQLDLNYNFIRIYGGCNEASEFSGIEKNNIWCCARRRSVTAGGYRWEYYYDYIDKNFNKEIPHKRRVVKLSLNMTFLNVYGSIRDARESTVLKNDSNIVRACKSLEFTAGGYRWMYEEDYNNQIIN